VIQHRPSGPAATQLTPGEAFRQAVSLHQLGRLHEAEQLYRALLASMPAHADAQNNLGHLLEALNRPEEALRHYANAIEIKPDYPEALLNLGNALQALGRHEEAIARYASALRVKPDFPEALLNTGNALQTLERNVEAVAQYEKALALRPTFAEAHYHLAGALEKLGRREDAVLRYERAIAIKPDYPQPHNNLGNVLRALNRYEEAIAHFEQACAIEPNFAQAQWNEAAARLTLGDFKTGWQKYEWRRLLGVVRPRVPKPLWLGGGDLQGQTILLYAEQGLGDTVQFARYASLVARQGARVVLEVQPELASLLTSLPGVSAVCARGEMLPPVDCQTPLMSLPYALRTTLETVPAEVPYLFPSREKLAQWRPAIEAGDGPAVGIKWRANETTGSSKSIPLELLRPLLRIPGLRCVALERDVLESDTRILRELPDVFVPGDRLRDFSDTAAIASMLDLVISVDTSVAHLTGALGLPLWLPLQFAADFRWLCDRADSPWYPSARLFRQSTIGDWASVVAQLIEELQRLAQQGVHNSSARIAAVP
jgi:tetratricopeptide (TPR) repeat protein